MSVVMKNEHTDPHKGDPQEKIGELLQRALNPISLSGLPQADAKTLQNVVHDSIPFLLEAAQAKKPDAFINYFAWQKHLLPADTLEQVGQWLERISGDLLRQFDSEQRTIVQSILQQGLNEIRPQTALSECLAEERPYQEERDLYLNFLLSGKKQDAIQLVMDLAESQTAIKDIYIHIFQDALYEIGHRWERNEVTIAEEHYCTAVTQLAISRLYPYLFRQEKNGHSLLAACVGGESHEVGLRMVADFFELEGWSTYYLGANMPTEQIVESAEKSRPQVLALSATLSHHVSQLSAIIEAVRQTPALANMLILVGGQPFNRQPDLWNEVGSDAYAANANGAVDTINRLIN